jgi:hypothetical protein
MRRPSLTVARTASMRRLYVSDRGCARPPHIVRRWDSRVFETVSRARVSSRPPAHETFPHSPRR